MGNADSKVAFKAQINRMTVENIPYEDEEYWNSLIKSHNMTLSEVIEALTVKNLRDIKKYQRLNISTFFKKVVNELQTIIHDGTLNQITKEQATTAITCVRLLTRVVPVILESLADDVPFGLQSGVSLTNGHDREDKNGYQNNGREGEGDEFLRELFWQPGGYVPIVKQEFQRRVSANKDTIGITPVGGVTAAKPVFDEVNGARFHIAQDNQTEQANEEDSILGIQILTVLQRLLFLKGFCVICPGTVLDEGEPLPKHKVDTRFIWKGGIGSAKEIPTVGNNTLFSTRTEVLRCLLTFLSSTLYQTVEEYQTSVPVGLWVFTRGYLPFTANLFCSLMSTVFSYNPGGFGIPYGSLIVSNQVEEELVSVSLQLLSVLVDFNVSFLQPSVGAGDNSSLNQIEMDGTVKDFQRGSDKPHILKGEVSNSTSSSTTTTTSTGQSKELITNPIPPVARNAFRVMIGGIKRESEIDMIYEGTVRSLQTIVDAQHTYLPRSSKSIEFHQEILILFWHLITNNSHFVRRVCSKLNTNKVIVPILYLLLDASSSRVVPKTSTVTTKKSAKAVSGSSSLGGADSRMGVDDDRNGSVGDVELSSMLNGNEDASGQEKVGLLHICSFVLLVLSSERDFSVKLNDDFQDKFPPGVPLFQGTHADLLILVTHRVISDSMSTPSNNSLVDMLLTVLCNISAYIKSFCLESCVKLLNLLARFSKPQWLFKAPYHYHDVFFLLDMFNNSIQYQYEGNLKLVYSMLRQKDLFLNLHTLQFPAAFVKGENSSGKSIAGAQGVTGVILDRNDSVCDVDCRTSIPNDTSSTHRPPSEDLDWKPTVSWFNDWKPKLPLHTSLRLINCLLPKVENECLEKGLIDQMEVLSFLEKTTMVGLLPVPHPIIIRNYHPNAYTGLWFTTFTWGVIFARQQHLELHDWKKIRFIVVNKHAGSNQR